LVEVIYMLLNVDVSVVFSGNKMYWNYGRKNVIMKGVRTFCEP